MNEDKLKELRKLAALILSTNAHWKSCQDGSYEMALHNSGYYDLLDEINEIKKNETN